MTPSPRRTEWPVMSACPDSAPGWALRVHQPTSLTSAGGLRTRVLRSISIGTTGASTLIDGTRRRSGSPMDPIVGPTEEVTTRGTGGM